MQVIYKYPLLSDQSFIDLPLGARPLCVQLQRGVPCIWALFDPQEKTLERHPLYIVPTGQPFDMPNCTYVGTVQFPTGGVYHFFLR